MSGGDPPSTPGLYETVAYRTDRTFLAQVPLALFLCALGLTMLAFPAGHETRHLVSAAILITAGMGLIGYGVYRRTHPSKPRFEISPSGVVFRIPGLKDKRIPWREVAAVDVIDVSSFMPSYILPRWITFRNVTALRVSRAFYDTHLHERSLVMRGPKWSTTFVVDDQWAKVALHHEALGVTPGEVYAVVEPRWRAFNPDAAAQAQPASFPEPSPGTRRTVQPPRSVISWASASYMVTSVILIGIILALIANILGYWQTGSQGIARAEREKWQAEFKKWEEEDARSAEERRKKDKEWDDFWRKQNF